MTELPHSFFFDKTPPPIRGRTPKPSLDEWASRVSELDKRHGQTGTTVCGRRASGLAERGAQSPCLDYCAKSETPPLVRQISAKTANRVRVFPSGELEVRTISRGSTAKPSPRPYGRRISRGVSANGRRLIRRAAAGLVASQVCQVALYTLGNYRDLPDREFNKRVHSFLAWGRKYVPDVFKHYVVVFELHARGVLHAHLLLFKRVPKGLWRRMRDLWAVRYDMGPGSFDVKKMRSASRAAAYLSKYLTDKKPSYRLRLDPDGFLQFEPWRVSRHNGEPYKRMTFSGNAYRVSDALRAFALPVAEYHLPWGSPVALKLSCNLRGGVRFFVSPAEAKRWITSNLASAP